jgi:uncharacterized repeat protein (TIGR03803 family)
VKSASVFKRIYVFIILCATAATPLRAQIFRTAANFIGSNGAGPQAALVQGTDGRFYGTTTVGGTDELGVVFRFTSSGTLTALYSFSGTDGTLSRGTLVQGTDGNFYSATVEGGSNGLGAIYKISPQGHYTTLYSFDQTDGFFPEAGLVQGSNGNFYGTTPDGGADNQGTVFELTGGSKLITLHSFCSLTNCTDGQSSFSSLIQGADQNFYGTALYGGANNAGTVFKINAAGTLTTIYNFCSLANCADGANPYDALIQGNDGNFYGTTYRNSAAGGDGTIFKLTPAGKLTTLYSFCPAGDCTTGRNPLSSLLQGSDGNFYGVSEEGGANGFGTLFQITPTGSLTTLHTFCSQTNCADGGNPDASVMQATTGIFYGVTPSGGTNEVGTIFSLSMGLAPFVKPQPTFGAVGAKIVILGNNLTGATKVKFNGIAAVFTVVSSTEITATVPSGATSGTIQVTTPSGTLNSNLKFRVIS